LNDPGFELSAGSGATGATRYTFGNAIAAFNGEDGVRVSTPDFLRVTFSNLFHVLSYQNGGHGNNYFYIGLRFTSHGLFYLNQEFSWTLPLQKSHYQTVS
jgi:hypothetical protein